MSSTHYLPLLTRLYCEKFLYFDKEIFLQDIIHINYKIYIIWDPVGKVLFRQYAFRPFSYLKLCLHQRPRYCRDLFI